MKRQKATRKDILIAVAIIVAVIGLTALHIGLRGWPSRPSPDENRPKSLPELLSQVANTPASQPATQPTSQPATPAP